MNFFLSSVNSESLRNYFYWIGVYVTVVFLYENLKSLVLIKISTLRSIFKNESLVEKFGSWAVVTGATDGIGLQYARQLAKNGLNIVLISRCNDKLRKVAETIEFDFNVTTKCIIADFSKNLELYEYIEHELGDIQVGILVNNVGTAYHYPEKFIYISKETNWKMLQVNCASCTIMCHIIIKRMLQNGGKGAIINISSGSSYMPSPYLATYGATKAYISSFTQSLQQELADTNITIQLVIPIFVVTKMINSFDDLKNATLFTPDAESYVRSSIDKLGKTENTTGYWPHALQTIVIKNTPNDIRSFFFMMLVNKFRNDFFSKNPNKAININ